MERSRKLAGVLVVALSSMLFASPAVEAVTGTEPVSSVAAGSLDQPFAVAIDGAGNLFISDRDNHRIQKVDTNNVVTTVAGGNGEGSGSNQLNNPAAVAVDQNGNLYIADSFNHRIQKVDTNNVVTTVAGGNGLGSGSNQLNNPYAVAVDESGSLFVADFGNARVQKVDTTNVVTTVAGGNGHGSAANQLDAPTGVAIDGDGNLFVAENNGQRVQKVDTNNVVTTVAGGNGIGSGSNQLSFPLGITVDAVGNLYIADGGNHRIQKVDIDNVVTTVAGGNGFGSAPNQLAQPSGAAFDTDGSLYIADAGNNRVQKLTVDDAPPVVTITTASSVGTGDALTAAFACTDVGASGLASCTATLDGSPIGNAASIDTTSPGTMTLVVTAVDNAGNTTTATRTITVATPQPTVGSRELTGAYAAMSGIDGSVARLYMAVFNRQPDAAGHAYWADRANDGLSLRHMAGFFIGSSEFSSTYDTLDNTRFVELLYRNVMDRTGDTAGIDYWIEQLDAGAARSFVVLQFSESPEFKKLTKSS